MYKIYLNNQQRTPTPEQQSKPKKELKHRIYKVLIMVFLMVKKRLQKKQPEKNCFGTKEWSENSGICNGCEKKNDCGKIKDKRANP